MADRVVSADGVSYAFGRGPRVLKGLTLNMVRGEVVGVLGRNGSGKTTLLRLVAGLTSPDEGNIEAPVRPAVVLDGTPFLEPLSAVENLDILLRLRGHPDASRGDDAASWLRAFQLSDDGGRPVSEFSLGMRRRLALAEAFAAAAPLLLLDEPTLGLDPDGRDRLARALAGAAARGASALVATNDALFAQVACSRVVVLHRGGIVADGAPGDLVAALGSPTMIDVEYAGASPGAAAPDGLSILSDAPGRLRAAADQGGRSVAPLAAWLVAGGADLKSLRVREPGLADVFAAHTGESLE